MIEILRDLAGATLPDYKNLTVVDCTIRDGGLMNDSRFDLDVVRSVFRACCDAGIDVCELGYRNSKKLLDETQFGAWRFCTEEDLVAATEGIENRHGTKISIMMDAHKSSVDDLINAKDSVADIIRIATYVEDIDKAIDLAKKADELGYETSLNIMAITNCQIEDLEKCLARASAETNVKTIFIVDSYGNLMLDQLDFIIDKFLKHIGSKQLGLHFHNNQQLAFANTITGISKGATWVDCTLNGLGRGAGNCPTELLISYLKNKHNTNYNLEPVLKVIGEFISPLKNKIKWGYHVPYMLTGHLNLHPQSAIEKMFSQQDQSNRCYLEFYRKLKDSNNS